MLRAWVAVGVVLWTLGGVSAHDGTTHSYQQLISSFPRNSDLLRIVMPDGVAPEEELHLISFLASLNRSPRPIIITFLTRMEGEYHVLNLPATRVRTH